MDRVLDSETMKRDSDQYPHPVSASSTAVMKGNRRVDTRPEVRIRSALHREGLRFRKDFPVREGNGRVIVRPDIVFTRPRVAVFIDGCFWHSCERHGRIPASNEAYWVPKLLRNIERDRSNDLELAAAGWTVCRHWEHEPESDVVGAIVDTLDALA